MPSKSYLAGLADSTKSDGPEVNWDALWSVHEPNEYWRGFEDGASATLIVI